MICALLFVNQKGEVITSRHYRDGFSKSVADTFRTQVIAGKEVGCLGTNLLSARDTTIFLCRKKPEPRATAPHPCKAVFAHA